ncbi:MAG: hypothetical protein ACP5NV_03190 [Candidatus Woesearchaeota archaeon]
MHSLRESHLEELCVSCKKPHGSNIVALHQHHKLYEIMTCGNCGYKVITLKSEKEFSNRFDFM